MEKDTNNMRIKHTIDEIMNMEGHVELIDGEIVVRNYTSTNHNEIVTELVYSILNHIKKNNGKCKLFHEEVAIWFNKISGGNNYNFFLPDIMVICPPKEVTKYGAEVAPDLVIEVVSPNTRSYDYNQKRFMYKKIGVREYWIIDSERKTAIQHLIDEDDFDPHIYYNPKNIAMHIYGDELVLDVTAMFL